MCPLNSDTGKNTERDRQTFGEKGGRKLLAGWMAREREVETGVCNIELCTESRGLSSGLFHKAKVTERVV